MVEKIVKRGTQFSVELNFLTEDPLRNSDKPLDLVKIQECHVRLGGWQVTGREKVDGSVVNHV